MECLMDGCGHENRRQRVDYFNWNRISQYQIKAQTASNTNAKISILSDEKDLAIRERDRALAEKKAALEERDAAIQQRDAAMAERDAAMRQRDNAIAALRFQESTAMKSHRTHGSKSMKNQPLHHRSNCNNGMEECALDASPVSAIPFGTLDALHETKTKACELPKKVKTITSKDLNRHVTTHGTKAEWDADQDFGCMKQIEFDKYTMPVPVCSCTGVPRHCYKWGNGGWQSSCCTTLLSVYPLPQMSNKRHSRIVGRKMSAGVFNRLLTRLVASGHDSSVPLDLKNYWAKHGTNRYITIK